MPNHYMCSVSRVRVDDKFSQNSLLIPQPQTIKINIWTHNGKCKDHLIPAHIQYVQMYNFDGPT